MRISFDLDETLFIDPKVNYTEPYLKFPYSIFFKDKLRKGTNDEIMEINELFDKAFIFETKRLMIRRLHMTDANDYFEKFNNEMLHVITMLTQYRQLSRQKN